MCTIIIHNVYVHQEAKPEALKLELSNSKHIVVGDFNSRHTDWEPLSDIVATPEGDSKKRGDFLHTFLQNDPNLVMLNHNHTATTSKIPL